MAETLSGWPKGRLRASRQAAAVQDVLQAADGFRTVQELYQEAQRRELKVGLATVYRYLSVLVENGSADVVHHENGDTQYRLCGSPTQPEGDSYLHHHHLVCRECGRSVQVSGPEVEAWAARIAAAAGYTQVSHTAEIFGLCPQHSAPDREIGTTVGQRSGHPEG